MKAGRTIEAMLQELARQSAAKEDYLVKTSCLVMETDGSVPVSYTHLDVYKRQTQHLYHKMTDLQKCLLFCKQIGDRRVIE